MSQTKPAPRAGTLSPPRERTFAQLSAQRGEGETMMHPINPPDEFPSPPWETIVKVDVILPAQRGAATRPHDLRPTRSLSKDLGRGVSQRPFGKS